MSESVTRNTDIRYFDISVKKLALLLLVTLGLYSIYWTYKNWKAVKLAEPAVISPFWRTFFSVIFYFSLFSRIQTTASLHGVRMAIPGKVIAAAMLILSGLSNLLSNGYDLQWWTMLLAVVLGIIVFIPLLYIQSIVNKSNLVSTAPAIGIQPSWVNLFFIISGILGTIVMILFIGGLLVLSLVAPQWHEAFVSPDPSAIDDLMLQQQQSDPAYQELIRLEEQVLRCQEDMQLQESLIDYTNQAAVDSYNIKFDECQAQYDNYNRKVDDYNSQLEHQ